MRSRDRDSPVGTPPAAAWSRARLLSPLQSCGARPSWRFHSSQSTPGRGARRDPCWAKGAATSRLAAAITLRPGTLPPPHMEKRVKSSAGGCCRWDQPWGDLRGCPRCPVRRVVRGVVRDGGGREAAARRGEVSRGRTTGGIDERREGPNAKPRPRKCVLAMIALTAANSARGLAGRVGGEARRSPVRAQRSSGGARDRTSPRRGGLWEQFLAGGNLAEVLRRVERNAGAAGIDGMSTKELRPWLHDHWPRIRSASRPHFPKLPPADLKPGMAAAARAFAARRQRRLRDACLGNAMTAGADRRPRRSTSQI